MENQRLTKFTIRDTWLLNNSSVVPTSTKDMLINFERELYVALLKLVTEKINKLKFLLVPFCLSKQAKKKNKRSSQSNG